MSKICLCFKTCHTNKIQKYNVKLLYVQKHQFKKNYHRVTLNTLRALLREKLLVSSITNNRY